MKRFAWLLLVVNACSDSSNQPARSPDAAGLAADAAVAPDARLMTPDAALGSVVTVRAVVQGTTWQRRGPLTDPPRTDRLVLLAVADTTSATPVAAAWGVAANLPGAKLQSREWRLPARGDTVEVTGTVGQISFNDQPRPILDPLTAYRIVTAAGPPTGDVGAACTHDMDCADDLWCARATATCAVVPPIGWHGDERNINGSCQSDGDCPVGQRCDPGYRIKGDGTTYSANYSAARDSGRFLCQVLDRTAPPERVCPRLADVADLLGGRYPQGKEICIRTTVRFPIIAPDRDTHIQAEIPMAGVYPYTEPTLDVFGAAFENAPPYKDPANPLGALVDPQADQKVDFLGTVHYDDSHGWWEVHPIKWYRVTQ